nr:hypothetical protein [Tanacetum cinerariifolium]
MRRVGKGFSGVKTPLFEGMLIAQEVGEGDADEVRDEGVHAVGVATEGEFDRRSSMRAFILSTTESVTFSSVKKIEKRNKVKVLKLRRLQRVGSNQRIDTSDDTMMDDVSNPKGMIADMDDDADVVLEEAKDVTVDAKDDQDADVHENADIQGRTAESQAQIYKINLDHANKVLSMHEEESEPTELQEVVNIVTTAKIITEFVTAASITITAADVPIPAAATAAPILTAAPSRRTKKVVIRELEAELNRTIDWDEVINHVNKKAKEDPAVKRYQALKRKPQTEAQARKNMMIYLKNVVGFKMDYFKRMSYDDIRPIFEVKFNSNVDFLQKTKEQINEEESRAVKRINETPVEKAAKRQKLDDENNKPYYKIKRADGSHQLYLSFLSLLRNFDREDLEALWSLVKERFTTTKPKNFFDDFMLITLREMFEKPDIHAQ